MIYHTYIPSQPLSDFVESFWFHEDYDLPHKKERRLPSGTAELVFNLRHDPHQDFGGAVLCGPFSESFILQTSPQSSLLGVQFKPGGALPFFSLPASEFHNIQVRLSELWRVQAEELRVRLLSAQTVEAKFRLLEQFLFARVTPTARLHGAVSFALDKFQSAPHDCTVSHVVERAGLSQQQFIRLFSKQVGLTPKLFLRLLRFRRVLHIAGEQRQVNWADLALDSGYFDQAHLIHDFRDLSGLTPANWHASRVDSFLNVPLTN